MDKINEFTDEETLDSLSHNILIEILRYLEYTYYFNNYDEKYHLMLESDLRKLLQHKNYKNQAGIKYRITGLYDDKFNFNK